jgi:CPA1 family monovalent cation:H+ antiporter
VTRTTRIEHDTGSLDFRSNWAARALYRVGELQERRVTAFDLAAVFMALVAAGGWVNAKSLRLPHAVAMLLVGLIGAGAVLALTLVAPGLAHQITDTVRRVDFAGTVLNWMLGFLLFAGAMQVDLSELRKRRLSIWSLATLGVAASTAIVGLGAWQAARWLGVPLSLPWALVFGALISPTDPIAVLATVKRGHLSKTLQVVLQGEALFNDGVGIVVFTALLAFATGHAPHPGRAVLSVIVQAAGGLALGFVASVLVIRLLRRIDDFVVEASLTLALAMAVYAGAQALSLSGPIAVVGAGLLIGDSRARGAAGEVSGARLESFWTLVDEILNGLLFLLLGLELVALPPAPGLEALCLAAVALVLLARFVVVLPWGAYLGGRLGRQHAIPILAWGGLHGALSLALALSVPEGPQRTVILTATYAVATFSVAVQGLTFAPLAARLARRSAG